MNLDRFISGPHRQDPRGEAVSQPSTPIRASRVLVADDEELIRRLISYALAKDGISVTAVSDGNEAWEALCQGHYDLLVTDNEMPQLTGVKLIERMRQAGMNLPVIMASGSFSMASEPAPRQQQIAAVLPKPFGMFELLKVVRNVLSSRADTNIDDAASDRTHAGQQTHLQPNEMDSKLCHH